MFIVNLITLYFVLYDFFKEDLNIESRGCVRIKDQGTLYILSLIFLNGYVTLRNKFI